MKNVITVFLLIIFTCFQTLFCQTAITPSCGGTSDKPYQIASFENLYWIANHVNNNNDFYYTYFKLTENIDASCTASWFSLQGWNSKGYNDVVNFFRHGFSGIYNSKGYTISDLIINRPSTQHVERAHAKLFT